MTIYVYPNIAPRVGRIVAQPAAKVQKNPYTNGETVLSNGNDKWRATISYSILIKVLAQQILDFLFNLEGPINTVLVKDWNHQQLGDWAGAPVVDGSNQEGRVLNIRGLGANKQLKNGDRFQIGNRLYRITADVMTNGLGKVALPTWPSIREIPADGAALITNDPRCLMYWSNSEAFRGFEENTRVMRNLNLEFEEALR